MEKEVPQAVKDEASWLIDTFGDSFEYLGIFENKINEFRVASQFDNAEVYLFIPPEGMKIGFPHIYLYKNGNVLEIDGPTALDIMGLFFKDI